MKRLYILISIISFFVGQIINAQKSNVCLYVRGIPNKVESIKKTKNEDINFGIIRGKVLKREDSSALKNISILINVKSEESLKTDENGFFEIKLKKGIYTIAFIKEPILKKTLELNNSEVIELEIHLGTPEKWVDFETTNTKDLKRKIRKKNRARKRLYWK